MKTEQYLWRFAAAALILNANQINAQSINSSADQIDSQQSRFDRVSRERQARIEADARLNGQKVKPFTFSISLPFTYNSNIEYSNIDEIDAFHFAPGAQVSWKQQFGDVILKASGRSDTDHYTEFAEDNNNSTLSANIGIQLDSVKLNGLAPYLKFKPLFAYGNNYSNFAFSWQDYIAGAFIDLGIGKSSNLEIDVNAIFRRSDSNSLNQNRFNANVTLSGDVSDKISLSLFQNISLRDYINSSQNRSDIYINTVFGITYNINLYATIDFNVSFENNNSSIVSNNYNVWDIGPTVNLSWKF